MLLKFWLSPCNNKNLSEKNSVPVDGGGKNSSEGDTCAKNKGLIMLKNYTTLPPPKK